MLQEIVNTQQVAGEPRRRWFFDHDVDLVVWEDEQATICGFQLAYDKYRNEHSLSGQKDKGFVHYTVDDGEPLAGANQSPLLHMHGPLDSLRLRDLFAAHAHVLPESIQRFITDKLDELISQAPAI